MKTRLLCLTMGILMLLTCLLTACGGSTTDSGDGTTSETVVDNSAKTITMWVLTDKATTPRAQELVNKEFTKITKSKFKTNVELIFCSAEGYWEKNEATGEYEWNDTGYYERLEKAIAENEKAVAEAETVKQALRAFRKVHKNEGWNERTMVMNFLAENEGKGWEKYVEIPAEEDDDDETTRTEEETILNEYQIAEIKYPEAKENQVDIFYVGDVGGVSGESKYYEYYNKEWLASLSESLVGSSNKLTKYISPTLLNGVQIEGELFGVPNNVTIGEYTYMMVDYDLLNYYKRTVKDTDTVADINKFLDDIQAYNDERGLTPEDDGYVVPLNSSMKECMNMLLWFWDVNYVDRTVYKTHYGAPLDKNGTNGAATAEERNYTLMQEYVEEKTSQDDEGNEVKWNVYTTYYAVEEGLFYKVNDDGKYVDSDGQVLNYRYELDETGGYMIAVGKTENDIKTDRTDVVTQEGDVIWHTRAQGAWYLVDENGNAVTPENDKRVIVTASDAIDALTLSADGKTYTYNGHLVEVVDEEDLPASKYDEDGRTLPTYTYLWNKDSDFSAFGAVKNDPSLRGRGLINLGFERLFMDCPDFVDIYTTLMDYDFNGYYGTPKENQTAAVFFKTGDARILLDSQKEGTVVVNGEEVSKPKGVYVDPETGKWYRTVVAENPTATNAELYGHMFAVYAQSSYLDRAMEVLTYLNTNATLRDVLQYGVAGTHFAYDETLVKNEETGIEQKVTLVKLLNSRNELEITNPEDQKAAGGIYKMNVEQTGNCFITTPTQAQGANYWEYGKIQNNNSLIDPLLGFDFNTAMDGYRNTVMDVRLLYKMEKLNIDLKARVDACTDAERLEAIITDPRGGLQGLFTSAAANQWISKLINSSFSASEPAEGEEPDKFGESPNAVYFKWLIDYGYAA